MLGSISPVTIYLDFLDIKFEMENKRRSFKMFSNIRFFTE